MPSTSGRCHNAILSFEFNMPNELTTWIALYGALLSTIVFVWELVKYIGDRRRKLKVTFRPFIFAPENVKAAASGTFTVIITNVARTSVYVEAPEFLYRQKNSRETERFSLSMQTERPIVYADLEAAINSLSSKRENTKSQLTDFPVKLEYSQTVTATHALNDRFIRQYVLGKSVIFWAVAKDGLGKEYISNEYRFEIL